MYSQSILQKVVKTWLGEGLPHACNPSSQESEDGRLTGSLNKFNLYTEF